MSDNPYKTLGLTKAATEAEIKAAYRKLVRTSHPDLHPDDAGAEARFKAISAAYDLLKDPETRGQFDRGEIDATGAPRQDRQFYRDYAGAADNPYRRGPRFDGDDDAADIFASFFRQREQRAGQQGFSAHGNDRRYSLEVPFLDAVNGGKTRIVLPGGGALEVAIPPGVSDGQTLRLRGKGDPGFEGGPPGDALVTLSVQPHMTFQRQGKARQGKARQGKATTSTSSFRCRWTWPFWAARSPCRPFPDRSRCPSHRDQAAAGCCA